MALLPTVSDNIIEALQVERLTQELQHKRAERLARVAEGAQSELSSAPSSIRDGDTASLSSFQTSSFMHTSQLPDDTARPRRSKAQLWNEIKISSITRACTLIYTLSLLTLLTRIQLNLLGRLSYVSSVVSLAQPQNGNETNSISLEDHDDSNPLSNSGFGNDFETNRRYLTFSWFLLHRGYGLILTKVEEAVKEIFGPISPTEQITPARLSDLVLAIRKKVEGPTEQDRYATRWLPYLLPPREDEESVLIESGVLTPPPSSSANSSPDAQPRNYFNTSSGTLRNLLDETADLIDSPTFTRIHTMILNALFSHLIDTKVAQEAFPPATAAATTSNPTVDTPDPLSSSVTVVPIPSEPKVKLATILAVFTRQAHAIGRGNTPPLQPRSQPQSPSQSQQQPALSSPTAPPDGHPSSTVTMNPITAVNDDPNTLPATSQNNEYLSLVDDQVRELEAFAAVIYAHNLHASPGVLDQALPPTAQPSSSHLRAPSADQTPGESQDPTSALLGGETAVVEDEGSASGMLESAWSKVVGGSSTFSSR